MSQPAPRPHRAEPIALTFSEFVGRRHEMTQLETTLAEVLSGQGRMVLLAGEPGIGKTRTAQELASLAESLGAKVFWGWSYEEEGAPPYWPWVQTIRAYVQQCDAEQLRSEMGNGAANIADVIPEIHDKISGLKPPPILEPGAARFRLFDSITTFLKNASQSQPLMLVLDDLHWADKPSLLLLQLVARELAGIQPGGLLLVCCFRDVDLSRQHPLSETLAQLSRSSSGELQRVLLRGLDIDETARFIEANAGIEPTTGLAEVLYSHTEGNPFFMTETIRLLSESGELSAGHTGTPQGLKIPDGVREVIGQRLNRLSDQCNEVLTTASIIGREFDFRLLNILGGETSEDQLLQAVDEAVSAHLIEDVPGHMDRYQFRHALIKQTLAEEVTTSRSVRLHARIAEGLEELYGDDAGSHAAELAYHFAEAEPVVGLDKLVKHSMLAGEKALEAYAQEEALAHFQRGLIAKGLEVDGAISLADSETAALLFGLGRAQAATLGRQQLDVAFTSLTRAFDFYAETKDVDAAVSVAVYPMQPLPGHRVAVELVTRALELVPSDSSEAGHLLSRYVLVMGLEEGDYQGAMDACDRALAIAQRTGDVELEMRTLAYSSTVDYWHLRWQGTVTKGLRVIDLARQAADQLSEVSARFWVGIALLGIGEPQAAQPHATAMLSAAESLRDRYWLATALWLNEMACSYTGDWQAAREFNQRGLSVSPSDIRLLGTRMLLEHEIGDGIEGHGYLGRLLEALRLVTPGPRYDYASVALMIPMVGIITGAVDQLHTAEDAAVTVLSAESATTLVSRFAGLGLALIAVLRGDREKARHQYVILNSAAGSYLRISGDRVLGLLAQTMGNLDQAAVHFQDAYSFCLKSGYRPELAWTCYNHAALLLRAEMGDRSKAAALLEVGLSISTELGMISLMDKAAALREELGSQPAKLPAYPNGLTLREVEVLRLIAAGKTDRAIAEELFIGVRTVSFHVSNILNKTDAANRTEAALFANQCGLI